MDPKTNTGTQTAEPDENVSGEGNYEATRRYNAGVEKSVANGDSDALAEEAKKALEGPDGEALRKAEEQGKQGGTAPDSK